MNWRCIGDMIFEDHGDSDLQLFIYSDSSGTLTFNLFKAKVHNNWYTPANVIRFFITYNRSKSLPILYRFLCYCFGGLENNGTFAQKV